MEISSANKFVAPSRSGVTGCILKKLQILTIIVAHE
jgi:hypothetical protein